MLAAIDHLQLLVAAVLGATFHSTWINALRCRAVRPAEREHWFELFRQDPTTTRDVLAQKWSDAP